ncbi:MAG: hypothetical protein M1360_02090 [Candidatus Marsarchaeota archaeon]|jgi:hypothetical protein|nr:hypothetical protein [Candidatus Marsarchaeota archaeon]MCL5418711.1 hypothetical protein [Candidatus Marsarchaeota archaeon]
MPTIEKSQYAQAQQGEAAKVASMLKTEAKQESTTGKSAENVVHGNPYIFKAKSYMKAGTVLVAAGMFGAAASVAVIGQLPFSAAAIDLSAIVADGIAGLMLLRHGYLLFNSSKG